MTRNSIPHSIINQLPSKPTKGRGPSVAEVVRSYKPNANDQHNREILKQFSKPSLIETTSTLLVRYYDQIIDADKLKLLSVSKLASILLNKLKSLRPQRCSECNLDFTILLNDPDYQLRKYCFSCGIPSHTCNSPPELNTDTLWLCNPCKNDVAGPHISIVRSGHLSPRHTPTSSTKSPSANPHCRLNTPSTSKFSCICSSPTRLPKSSPPTTTSLSQPPPSPTYSPPPSLVVAVGLLLLGLVPEPGLLSYQCLNPPGDGGGGARPVPGGLPKSLLL